MGFFMKDFSMEIAIRVDSPGLKKNFRNIPKQAYFQIKELTYKGLIRNRKTYTNPESIHFILWPEGAYPYLVPKYLFRIKDASSLVEKVKIPLITGGTRHRNISLKVRKSSIFLKNSLNCYDFQEVLSYSLLIFCHFRPFRTVRSY